MSKASSQRLTKASDLAARDQVQHIVLMVAHDGRLKITGSSNMVDAIYGNEELYDQVEKAMQASYKTEGDVVPQQILHYPVLPCSPFTPEWENLPSTKVRKILTQMLDSSGYGRSGNKRKLGLGPSPPGWPEKFPWDSFSGATRSKLTKLEITEVITSLLLAANCDLATHTTDPEDKMNNGNHVEEDRPHSEPGKGVRKPNRNLDQEFKQEVAHFAHVNSNSLAAEKYGIPGGTIRRWVNLLNNPKACDQCPKMWASDSELAQHIRVNQSTMPAHKRNKAEEGFNFDRRECLSEFLLKTEGN